MIVVDTNVIASLYLPGPNTEAAERALSKDPEWVVPLSWRSELRNVLAGLVRVGRCPLSGALEVMDAAHTLLEAGEYEVGSADVVRLAAKTGCSAYDCELVSLARDLDVRLVTLDRGIRVHFPKLAVPLGRFAPSR